MSKVVSFRLSEEDYQWFERQGGANEVCRRIALEQRNKGKIDPKFFRMMKEMLESVRDVDAKANEILSKLPADDSK